jgi:hypothetical protein
MVNNNPYREDGYITGIPTGTFSYVLEFCNDVVNNGIPVYVSVNPIRDAKVNECFPNVERVVKERGGESIIGWQIWEWYGVMIEAEFHAIWRNPQNELVDITPKVLPFEKILFLPDPNARYEERQINNIRKSLNNDLLVEEFIRTADKKFTLLNEGGRATQRAISLSEEESREHDCLQFKLASLLMQIINKVPGRNELCRCGSGRKFKKCHGR